MNRVILKRLLAGEILSADESEALMGQVMTGQLGQASLGAALAAWQLRGPVATEIAGAARAMRRHMIPVRSAKTDQAVDTCGTGGDGSGSFNISTAAALVTAACGVPVAKHGNRAASSRCGSADVLEALGVQLDLGPDTLGHLLDEIGLAFLFAPQHHPAMRHAMPVRKELGVRTIFNLLGPLTNPAGVGRQLVGVYSPDLCDRLAGALREVGSRKAWVGHGHNGLDEVALTGPTRIVEMDDGKIESRSLQPEDVGLERCLPGDLAGGDAKENAELLQAALAGEAGPRTDAVVLNAGCALVIAGVASDPAEGVTRAREAVDDGRALRLLNDLVTASNDLFNPAAEGQL